MTEAEIIDIMRRGMQSSGFWSSPEVCCQAILAALRAHGMEVLSVEPTEAMRIAAVNTTLPGVGEPPLYEKIWRAMVSAANG